MEVIGVLKNIEKNGMTHQKDEWIGKAYSVSIFPQYGFSGMTVACFQKIKETFDPIKGNPEVITTSSIDKFDLDIRNKRLSVKTRNSTYTFEVERVI